MEILESVLGALGNTPLVRLDRFFEGPATLAAKLEFFNPGASVKDRIGVAMIEAAELSGQLKPGDCRRAQRLQDGLHHGGQITS